MSALGKTGLVLVGRHLKMTEKAVSEAGEEVLRSRRNFSLTTETSGSPGLRTA